MHISKPVLAGTMLLLVLLLQGCGRKGPLFMPPAQPAPPAKVEPEQMQPGQTQAVPNQTTPSQTEPNK